MLRPIYADLLGLVIPLTVGAGALVGGLYLHRLPAAAFRTVIATAVAVILTLGVSYFIPFPEPVYDLLWWVGGEAPIACILAALLLGVVASAGKRSTSTGFLSTLVGFVALILVLSSGGRLWWRLVSQEAWRNRADTEGCVTQSTGWTCSPATATMLLHRYGVATSEGEMAYLANTSYLGTDVRSIAQAIDGKSSLHGFKANIAFANYEACLQRPGPFLACIRVPGLGGHAVLVLRMRPDSADVVDPRFGHPQTLDRKVLEAQWEGKIVFLTVVSDPS